MILNWTGLNNILNINEKARIPLWVYGLKTESNKSVSHLRHLTTTIFLVATKCPVPN